MKTCAMEAKRAAAAEMRAAKEETRDYNELGLYLHGKTMQTAMELWEMLPGWMEARRMALVDPAYNRKMSAMVADLAGTVQKAAQEMAEWGQEE